jgi:hypothetical protein
MRLQIRIVPNVNEGDEIPIARVETLRAGYTLRIAAEIIDQALDRGTALKLILESGDVLELADPSDYASIALADADVTTGDDVEDDE